MAAARRCHRYRLVQYARRQSHGRAHPEQHQPQRRHHPRQNLLFPFPQFSGININNLPIGGQNYNGLQTRLTKRFSRGLTFVASYSWSKTLEQLTLLNPQDLNLNDVYATRVENRSAQETDVPHKFSFAGVYELPFGRGRSSATT